MRPDLSKGDVEARLARQGMRILRRIPRIDVWVVEDTKPIRASSPRAVLSQDPDVLWAESNGRVRALGITPDDDFYQARQWNLRQIGLPEAWVFTRGDTGPIAVIDTGVDLDHPDLAAKMWTSEVEIPGNGQDDDENGYVDDVHGWDFVSADGAPDDDHGHGSHVAGIAAARTNNGLGVAGVAWDSRIMPLKVLDQAGNGWWDDVLEAVVYAADNGASVLNLSLGQEPDDPGSPVPVQAIEYAVSYARSRGCLLVAAAGNNANQPAPVMYPAASPGVLAVAATAYGDVPFSIGNRGPEVDVTAPGVDIFSTTKDGGYTFLNGTSMAAPHVGGLAALLWSLDPTLTADAVTQVITSTARDVYTFGWDERTGWGRIDAQAAVLGLAQPKVDLVSHPTSILVGEETAAITATVTYSQSQPVPDGLTVAFSSNFGHLRPHSVTTRAGQATTQFSSTVQSGEALVTASVGPGFDASLVIEVLAPDINVDPAMVRIALEPGYTVTRTLTIGNVGDADLNWSLVEVTPAGWVSESLTGGALAPSGATDVLIAFDAAGLTPGVYATTLRISSDDPDEPQLDVPLRLLVACCRVHLPGIVRHN